MATGNQPAPSLFDMVLYEPEIPPNTGNIIRLCANAGCRLHLVGPLGFSYRDKHLHRAGLDYRQWTDIVRHPDWSAFETSFTGGALYALTTRGGVRHDTPRYRAGDAFVLGPESRGLPDAVLARFPEERRIRIPMMTAERSLNLANAAAIVLYEAWRQLDFCKGR